MSVAGLGAQIIGAVVVGGERFAQDRAGAARQGIAGARHRRDERLQEQQRGDERRDRVAGQAEHHRIVQSARHHRLARAQRDPPEVDRPAGRLERGADEIVVADRRAAGGDEDVRVDPRKGAADDVETIGQDAQIDDVDGHVGEHRFEHRAVRFRQACRR